MENKTNNETREMDLIDLFHYFSKAIKKSIDLLKKVLISLLRVHLKYWYILLIFIAAGIATTIITKPKEQITADFHLKTFFVPAKMVIDNINALNNKIDQNGNAQLAKSLGLSNVDVRNITSISACRVYDKDEDGCPDMDITELKDTSKIPMKYALHVSITTNGECDFEKVKSSIIEYYNNDKNIAKFSKYNYDVQMYELSGYEAQIRKVDSVRAQIAGSGKFSIDNSGEKAQFAGDPYSIKEMQDLIETCARIKFALTNQRVPVESLSPTNVCTTNSSKKKAVSVIFISYLIGLAISYIIKNRKSIKEAIKED